MTAKVAALTAAGQEPDAAAPASASGQQQRTEPEAAWALPGALELPDGSGKSRMLRRGSSVNSLAKTASQHMRGKSYARDSDGVPDTEYVFPDDPDAWDDDAEDGNYALEWWYKIQVSDNITVTPAMFYLTRPYGDWTDARNDTSDAGSQDSTFRNLGALVKTTFKF